MIAKMIETESESLTLDYLNRMLDLFVDGSITLDEMWESIEFYLDEIPQIISIC
jgi:hypothetical protein